MSKRPSDFRSLFAAGSADRSVIARILVAIAISALVITVQMASDSFVRAVPPLLWLTLAVLFAAWWGGLWSGLVATAICAGAAEFIFLSPRFGWVAESRANLIRLATFILTSGAISTIAEALHRAIRRERRHAEALRISEERLRLAVLATEDAIWDWELSTGEILWSPAMGQRFGWPEALAGTPESWWAERIHPEERDRTVASIRAAIADPSAPHWEAEYRFRRGDGTYADVLDRGSVLRDETGRAVRMLGTMLDLTGRRQAEINRASLTAIVENSDDAIVGTNLDGVVTSWNRGAERLFGYTAAEIVGQNIVRIFPPDRLDEEAHVLKTLRGGGKISHYESIRLNKDGRRIHVSITTFPIHDATGKIVGISKIARDISGEKRVEQALRESEHRWRELAEAMPHLVWTCRPDGYCDFLSSQWVGYTGRPAEEQLGYVWAEATHPADREATLAAWQAAATSGAPLDIEFRIRRHDGEYRWFKTRAVPIRDEAGHILRWYGSNTDIEDLKRAQAAAVRAAEQRMLAVEAAGMGAWEWNVETGVVTWSDRAYEMFGVPRHEQATFDRFIEAVHPEDREHVAASLRASLASFPHRYQCEYRVLRPDGTVRWLFGKGASQNPAERGQPARMIGITVDVTDRVLGAKELAAALNAAEAANRAKDAFLAALSHELRTPLTPVLFLAATLERADEVPERLRQDFSMIRRNIELEARLIDDLLDLTRITRGKLHLDVAPVELHMILQRSLELLSEDISRKTLKIECSLDAPLCGATADALRLQQIFWNVLKNAVKFTPAGGTISVLSTNPDRRTWRVSIRDSGLGITAEELPQIFDAFAQGREATSHRFGGLGLGLAITSLLTKEHGGRIWAESGGRDQGATFHIELPLASESAAQTLDSHPTLSSRAVATGRLLIVEDHEPTRTMLERLLTRRGYHVEIAESAHRARTVAAAHSFDLMISDLGLPDGSGHELAAEFGRAYDLKAIALSGYGMEEDVRRSRTAGFLAHITKPVDIESLHDAIARILHPF